MMLKQDIVREATRLTRAGQLVEATALLQRMLCGETSPGMTFGTAGDIAAPTRREPLIIDAKANIIEETDRPHSRVTSTQSHMLGDELLRRTRKRTTPGLRARIKRAPPSTRDLLPEGAKFIEGTHSNPAGSRTYRLFIPSRYHGQPLPLVVMLHGCTQSPDDFAAGTRMNFTAEEQTCFVVYPAQPSEANQAKCWNWFRTPTSGGAAVNLRLSRASRARLCATIRSTRSASTWADCRPERPRLPSWEQRTTICTRQSACTLASPVGLPLTFPLPLSPCDKVVWPLLPGPATGKF